MTDSEAGIMLAAFLGFVLMFFGGCSLGQSTTRNHWQQQCVEKGVAQWKVSTDGSTTFQWKGE